VVLLHLPCARRGNGKLNGPGNHEKRRRYLAHSAQHIKRCLDLVTLAGLDNLSAVTENIRKH